MFGIIYLAYGAIIKSLANLSEAVRNATFRQETYDAETGLYYDSKMRCYDSTMGNRQVFLDTKNMGRMVTRDLKTFELLRDITQERMDRELKYYREHPDSNHTVVKWSTLEEEPKHGGSDWDVPWGTRYKDVNTGDIYVKRDLHEYGYDKTRLFYMNVDTGMLVRVADGEYEKSKNAIKKVFYEYTPKQIEDKINEEKCKDIEFINEFNKHQLERTTKGMHETNGRKFYCNRGAR